MSWYHHTEADMTVTPVKINSFGQYFLGANDSPNWQIKLTASGVTGTWCIQYSSTDELTELPDWLSSYELPKPICSIGEMICYMSLFGYQHRGVVKEIEICLNFYPIVRYGDQLSLHHCSIAYMLETEEAVSEEDIIGIIHA